jgi:hypothetical protein
MPLTFLLLSLPLSIGVFLIILAIAVLHEMFAVESHTSEHRIALLNKGHFPQAPLRFGPRKSRALSLKWQPGLTTFSQRLSLLPSAKQRFNNPNCAIRSYARAIHQWK